MNSIEEILRENQTLKEKVKYLSDYCAELEGKQPNDELLKALKEVVGAIKGGWHEKGEIHYTQRFGISFIKRLEDVLLDLEKI